MMKKKIAAILTCAMVLAGIAGCGNSAGGEQSDVPLESKTEDEQKTETENKENADSGETAAASEASDGGELSGTLVFWSGGDLSNETDLTTKWIKETVDMFAEMHPNLKVEQTYVPGGDYLTKITTEIAADNAPDVFQTWLSGRLEPFVTAGQVMPIEHMLESYPGTAAIMNEKGLNLGTFDGKKYAIPLVASGEMVFYNKKIFEENGISVPQTYDELLEIVDTLKGKGITPCNLGISDPWPGTIPYMMIFNRLNGNDLYESVVLNKEADFANEGFVNAGNKLLPVARAVLREYPRMVSAMAGRHFRYNAATRYVREEELAGRLFVIRPPEPLRVGSVEKDPEQLDRVYQIGRTAALECLPRVLAYLEAQ